MRNSKDILQFRSDFSPFLVHLTRQSENSGNPASEIFKLILESEKLIAGDDPVSLASFGIKYQELKDNREKNRNYFNAVCLTETPLNEIHCLLDIRGRKVQLEPYGLVFLRDSLEKKGVSPVIYLNNHLNDKTCVIRGLCKLIDSDESVAKEILPLISVFGNQVLPYSNSLDQDPKGSIDFRWEREWRYPAVKGVLSFDSEDIFIGLCPHDEIDQFEKIYPKIKFMDPRRNMKWYSSKLIEARQRIDIEHSVL